MRKYRKPHRIKKNPYLWVVSNSLTFFENKAILKVEIFLTSHYILVNF